MKYKVCAKCLVKKDVKYFYSNKNKRDKKMSNCIECHKNIYFTNIYIAARVPYKVIPNRSIALKPMNYDDFMSLKLISKPDYETEITYDKFIGRSTIKKLHNT